MPNVFVSGARKEHFSPETHGFMEMLKKAEGQVRNLIYVSRLGLCQRSPAHCQNPLWNLELWMIWFSFTVELLFRTLPSSLFLVVMRRNACAHPEASPQKEDQMYFM